ncbi:MAG: tRNA (adenosine(37)-N6)-threonylcarbamoyltransferase complex ATPase subunit type 1 TsaE [Anaerolineaceae bacterium]|nr:tRNA (adenosine(37)-N6)-threonylcarbamoyltransferase complex ATPase subunit type 1 TsaE [Anaerolineaceae bacterium]
MPILDAGSLRFVSRSPEQTRRLGMRMGTQLHRGDVICLSGDLGAGKTTLVQGIASGWGSPDQVTSPSFILVNLYQKPDGGRLHHLDAYRLESCREAEDLDLNAMLDGGILVVEWAERIGAALPPDRLWIEMIWIDDEQRSLVFTPWGERSEALLLEFRKRTFGG